MSRKRINRRKPKYHPPVTVIKNSPISTGSPPSPAGHFMRSITFFSGPLPPAEMLRQYESLLPGSADRVFKMAEAQAEHRRELEKRITTSDIFRSYAGMAFALVVAVFGMYIARDIVLSGSQITGALFGFGALGALVGAFLKATHDRKEIISEMRRRESDPESKQNQPNR